MGALSRIPNVELMHTGQFPISTGTFVFTSADLRAAVASQECPAVRRPVLKLGHVDPRFDGEPAVGYVANMAVAEDGRTLVGDYAGMPGWMGPIMASAYPDRSIEGRYDFVCQMGHTHNFVIEAVALLGVTPPGIGTLASLQDVAELYGIENQSLASGSPVTVVASGSSQGVAMPEAADVRVAASVSAEDVRRTYYAELDAAGDFTRYIEEIQVDPLQLIVVNDADGSRWKIPVSIDGNTPAFGTPSRVTIEYVDASAQVAASHAPSKVRYETKQDSRPAAPKAASDDPAFVPTAPLNLQQTAEETNQTEEAPVADTFRDALVAQLGLPADISDEELTVKLGALRVADEDTAPAEKPEGVVTLDEESHRELVAAAALGREAHERFRVQDREALISASIKDGKIAPSRADHYRKLYDADASGAQELLGSLAPGLVPVAAAGYAGTDEVTDDGFEAELAGLYGIRKEN